MTNVWLNMQYEITKLPTRFEAEAVLHWYAGDGYYRVNAVGFGATVEDAKKTASLMLGQARAALHVALIGDCTHRVPAETSTEDVDIGRSGQPVERAT
jgi:hypothetical protein